MDFSKDKPDAVTAKDAPLPLDTQKLDVTIEASRIDVASLIGPVKPDNLLKAPIVAKGEARPASRWRLPAYAPLAAGIALAACIGAIAGAAATLALKPEPAAATTAPVATDTHALQTSVAQLEGEIAALKAGLGNSQRSATAQFNKLTERLDRTEKAQTEPAAKLTKLTETVDRLEKRQQQQSAAIAATAAQIDPDMTGSVMPYREKEEMRPPVAEGWRLRDFYSGRAVVESRNGRLFEVGPGSNLPGLGRVESIKRENGRVVVVARNGIITASSEPRRPPAPIPYRY